ncbi:hypothetical protein Hanom_Chr17g01575831 [Helianthus anomalus]
MKKNGLLIKDRASTGWIFDEVGKEKVTEEEVVLGDSTGWIFGVEEEVEQPSNEDQMSWENEFREELDGLPVDEEPNDGHQRRRSGGGRGRAPQLARGRGN